ncbi:type IV pilus assembly protein PilX [Marinobacter gudaonensis]|jgi:type IV pilus assembly protein PilX|uniref:Type IV pilus assembly protein PilX n=1 Tax=Marinobacter gudaonensis TaxID=375760 RepID=A0A1I6I2C1_9GAMM|nr:PilX N-terminal domain-containing pilus assembly protein [Marinobacter gudaonensis]SFR60886.1 type IV pilus assembly protein PilX [Marinobacter gudaonensis]
MGRVNFTRQAGAALILSLLMLLVLTLLAVSSMQGTIMQERMVSGEREGMQSLEIAESALRDAELYIENVNLLSEFDGSGGLYGETDTAPDPKTFDWTGSTNVRTANAVDGVTPRYFIQHMGEARQPEQLTDLVVEGYSHETGATEAQAFRIVAWSPGPTGESTRIIESYYAREM